MTHILSGALRMAQRFAASSKSVALSTVARSASSRSLTTSVSSKISAVTTAQALKATAASGASLVPQTSTLPGLARTTSSSRIERVLASGATSINFDLAGELLNASFGTFADENPCI